MKRIFNAAGIIVVVLLFYGCSCIPNKTVTQVSTIDALLAGAYDGQMYCRDLLRYGDFGIGTFDRLEGEMVVLDGNIYQVKADGSVFIPSASMTTPFASVCRFVGDTSFRLEGGSDFQSVCRAIDRAVPNRNVFCAVKITGAFRKMKTRSVPAQVKPYPPLAEVTKNQPVFEMENVSGTIVGFRCPPFIKGINVPGYHLHFISDDRKSGGHILDFQLTEGHCSIAINNRFFMILPEGGRGMENLDLTKDRGRELEKVEK
jgi:acetolactate decarboxylase